MSEEITVSVNSYGDNRPLSLVYFDPVSGKKIAKSVKVYGKLTAAEARDWRTAERLAGELESKLRAGEFKPASKITWPEFRTRYETEAMSKKGRKLAPKTLSAFRTAANHLERALNPDKLCKLTAPVLAQFSAKLRDGGMSDVTLGATLRHLHAALAWAADEKRGLLSKVPKMDIPEAGGARARAVAGEEFDRMISAVPKVRPVDSEAWIFYLNGLWLSGLRLEESLILSWDEDAPFAVDLTGGGRLFALKQKHRRHAATSGCR